MSFPSGTNKKNLKIKNISFMSPITRTKINISNLIAETQRIITNSNSNKISQFQNSEINSPKVDINFNKDNQFISDLYRSFSPKGPNIVSPQNESNNITKKNISKKKNNIKIKKASPSPSAMLTKFANFAKKLNNHKNLNYSYIGKKPNVNNKRNQKSNIDIRNYKKSSLTNTNSFTNIYKNSKNENNLNNNKSFLNQTQNLNIDQMRKKTNEKINEGRNFSNDNFENNTYSFPLSPKSMNNNNYIQQIYKREEKNELGNRNIKNNNEKKQIPTQTHQSENYQNIITTNQSTIKKLIINSRNSSLNEGNLYNKNKSENINNMMNTLNIDSPEELHFFYINILQNGRELEGKFELSNSINS